MVCVCLAKVMWNFNCLSFSSCFSVWIHIFGIPKMVWIVYVQKWNQYQTAKFATSGNHNNKWENLLNNKATSSLNLAGKTPTLTTYSYSISRIGSLMKSYTFINSTPPLRMNWTISSIFKSTMDFKTYFTIRWNVILKYVIFTIFKFSNPTLTRSKSM